MHVSADATLCPPSFASDAGMISSYRFTAGGRLSDFLPTPALSCRLQTLSWRNGGNRDEDRQKERRPIRLAASVPFSLSAAGNLPRNVTAEH